MLMAGGLTPEQTYIHILMAHGFPPAGLKLRSCDFEHMCCRKRVGNWVNLFEADFRQDLDPI